MKEEESGEKGYGKHLLLTAAQLREQQLILAGRQTFASSSCRQVFSHGGAEPAPHFSGSGPGPLQDSIFLAIDAPGYVLPRGQLMQVCPFPAVKRLVPAEVPELGGL